MPHLGDVAEFSSGPLCPHPDALGGQLFETVRLFARPPAPSQRLRVTGNAYLLDVNVHSSLGGRGMPLLAEPIYYLPENI